MVRLPRQSVTRHGIAVSGVQEMGPLVHRPGPWFHPLLPLPLILQVSCASRCQYAKDFLLRRRYGGIGHDQVYEVVCIGQALSIKESNGDRAMKTRDCQPLSCRHHILRVTVQSMHNETVVTTQGCRELSIPAAEVNNEAPPDASLVEDALGLIFRLSQGLARYRD